MPRDDVMGISLSLSQQERLLSITTPIPQKRKVFANSPGMTENFRLQEKLSAMSHL